MSVCGITLLLRTMLNHIILYIAIMQRPKHQTHKKEPIYNPEFTPKIPAKKRNLRKIIIGGQQSAQQGHRPARNTLQRDNDFAAMTEEQIRSSAIYRMLQEQMKVLAHRHEIELKKLREIKEERQKQQANLQKQQYQTKVQIWQLKNEVLDLKQSIKQEKQQTLRLMSELGIEDQNAESGNPTHN